MTAYRERVTMYGTFYGSRLALEARGLRHGMGNVEVQVEVEVEIEEEVTGYPPQPQPLSCFCLGLTPPSGFPSLSQLATTALFDALCL